MMPAAAYLLLCDLTCRLRTLGEDDRHQTRRTIGKLAVHFYPFVGAKAQAHAEVAVTLILATATDERLAWECLAACARVDRDERNHQELMVKLGSLESLNTKLNALAEKMGANNG
jgi:hypothetical protein